MGSIPSGVNVGYGDNSGNFGTGRFRRGEIIVEHGRKSNALFILLTGRARVLTADSRGREVILAVLQPGGVGTTQR